MARPAHHLARPNHRPRARTWVVLAVVLALASVFVNPLLAAAASSAKHEITANWAGSPAPTTAPFGQALTGEWHINTNDVNNPEANDPVANVRATLTLTNGVFASIPAVCKMTGVTPVSSISANGSTLVCNLGTVKEGTSTVIQAPVRVSGQSGGNLSASGTVTSDAAVAPAGPASPTPLPITYVHGMNLSLNMAPGQAYQGAITPSRTGGSRTFVLMNFSLILAAGSRPGPSSYSFPVNVSASIPAQMAGLQWEGCVPIGAASPSTAQPFSVATQPDRTNFPTCTVAGAGASYTVTASNLTYTLVNTPTRDSLGAPLPGTGAYIASGTVEFSIPAPVTALTTFTFDATGAGPFTFSDGQTLPDVAGDNTSSATLPPPGYFSNVWLGDPTYSRSAWDANLWVSPGTSQGVPLPTPGINTIADYYAAIANGTPKLNMPLYMQANDLMWQSYNGPGGAQLAGVCTMSQNPNFVVTSMDGGGFDVSGYHNYSTARYFYTTTPLNTKTETCGEASPGPMWTEVSPPAGSSLSDPRIAGDSLMNLPAGVTAVKMTWNPAVDRAPGGSGQTFLRAFGYLNPAAPSSGEGWTIGAFNYPGVQPVFAGYPTLNGYVNYSTVGGGTNLPGSAYGPNMNGIRDAFRLQGPQGVVTKAASDTTAQPGVPVTYTITAEAQSNITSPPPVTFPVVDTLPVGMVYVAGSGTPTPVVTTNGGGQQVLTWTFTNVAANVFQNISYQAETPAGSVLAPGSSLTNVVQINVPGDQRPATTAGRQASATVVVPNSASTTLGKSAEANVLSFYGDSSAWDLVINSQDPVNNPYTDTIDILPSTADGRGTNIDGSYSVTGVTPPAGSTVYYSSAPIASLSKDPRVASNGGTPGSVTGNTVGWSTTAVLHPTAIRVIAPALAPGATQTIRIAFSTPAGTSCVTPAALDNKPRQKLVNSAETIAGHTALPMLSSATTTIGDCYALDLKKYVLAKGGNPASVPGAPGSDWHDANTVADYPQYVAGDTVPFRIVVTNKGTGTLTNIPVTDSLVPACNATVASLAAGASQSINCTMTAAVGSTVNTAAASVTPPDGPPLTPSDPAGFVVPAPFHVVKTSDAGQAAAPGSTIHYTLTVSEPVTSAAPFLAPSLTDSLTDVLDDANYNGDVSASLGTATVTGSTLSWSAASIMPGQSLTISYSVTVKSPDTGNQLIPNTVLTPAGSSNCSPDVTPADPLCTVTTRVPSYTTAKSAAPASTVEGGVVTYTVTVRNTGPVAYPATGAGAASFTDALAGVTDDASYVAGSATASAGTVLVAGGVVSWSGPLATAPGAGSTVTISYQVKVNTPDTGDHLLTNTVVPNGPGGTCATAGGCSTLTPVQSYTVAKSASPASAVPGGKVTYTVTVRNTGKVAYPAGAPASFTDDLTQVLDDATYNNDASGGAGYTAPNLTWAGALAVGATLTITYSVTINNPDAGDHLLTNSVLPSGSGGSCATPGGCTTRTPVASYTVAKSASTTTTTPGSTVTYTVLVTNTGQAAYTVANPASFTDNLSAVLDDATYNNDADQGATYAAPTLSWSGALAVGASVTVTYTVTVGNPDRGNHSLDNTAVPTGPGGGCTSAAACTTIVLVQSFRAVKSSPAVDVTPGEVVPYTVTITNTGKVPYTLADPASWTDDLSAVLDDATYNNDATSGATYAAPTLSWSGALAVGASVTISYSVTVNTPDTGDQHLDNAVVTGPGGNCVGASNDPACQVHIPSKSFTVLKTASAAVANPGDTVTYTLLVTNTGQADYTAGAPLTFTDDLSGVLDDATYNNNASNGASYAAPILSWSGPLAVGASFTITYTVTVKSPASGDRSMLNAVHTPSGGNCTSDSTDPGCLTLTAVRSFTVAKTATPATTREGQTVDYTITVSNTGSADYTAGTPASFTDDLTKVLDDAVYNNDASNGATYSAPTLSWSGALAVGAQLTITYSVTVQASDTGDHKLINAVTPTGPGGQCATIGGCATRTPVQSFTVAKSSSPSATVPGGKVTYTITVHNTGQVGYTAGAPASMSDNLSQVLDDATYNGDADQGASYSAPILSWSGALAIGATVTVTYSVTVHTPDAGDHLLTNAVIPNSPGGQCATPTGCDTITPVASYTVTKTASVTTTRPGQQVGYTIVVTNTGPVAYTAGTPASFNDNLSAVLDDATYNGDADNGASYAAPVLSWSGALPVGGTVTISYSVTVNDPDLGDHLLDNAAVPTGPGGSCVTAADCAVQVPVQSYRAVKTTPATKVIPGETISYTIAVSNTGQVPYTAVDPAAYVDDLSKVLDDASYNNDASNGASYSAPVISWSGALAIGQTATFTYSVTVRSPDTGDKKLHNSVVTPSGSGGNCPAGTANPECTSNVPGPALHVVKTASVATAKLGEQVTYKIVLTNTGQVDFTTAAPASFTDDLSKVLDDASYNNDADQGATFRSPILSWSGALAIGASTTISYSVTVHKRASGNNLMDNTVTTPPGLNANCSPGSTDPACMVRVPVADYLVNKVASTTHAKVGDKVSYTIKVTNTGQVGYTKAAPASLRDDLSQVLDDAVYNNDATAGATYAKPVISWSGALPIAGTVTIRYSVTVSAHDHGDGKLHNVVTTPTDPGGHLTAANCPTGSADPACQTMTAIDAVAVTIPLSYTGVDSHLQLILAGLLLGFGAVLLLGSRRRNGRRHQS